MQSLAIEVLGSKSQDDDHGNVLGAGVVPGNLSQQGDDDGARQLGYS